MVGRVSMQAVLIGGVAGAAVLLGGGAAGGATAFTAVAAGDMSADAAILWTRTADPTTGQPVSVPVTALFAADPAFSNVLLSYKGRTDAARAGTVKIDATGLRPHSTYYYRFVAEDGAISATGRFTTAPRNGEPAAIRLGFSGDAHGAWRPYPLIQEFGALKLDYFVFLGDTMYESASKGSPAAADPFADPARALLDYRRKYLENILPVKAGGLPSLQAMFAAQGNYTLLDNHELGNKQFQNGGAPPGDPPGTGADAADPSNDATPACAFMNRTPGFAALLQAYLDFEPVRERRVSAPGDCRSDGTWQLYFAQRWGKGSIFINVDDRSYRDIRLTKPDGKDDTGPRADNPARTMLGATQLAWLERTLLDAQKEGIVWKIVAISSPIDQVGVFELSSFLDGGKSWIGGYRAERNRVLKFIADNRIEHVIFLTTDDHQNRVQGLSYLADPGDPKSAKPVPGALTVVAGPIGAGGPDRFKEHGFAVAKSVADTLAADERAAGIAPLGLPRDFAGLRQVFREGDPQADALRQPADYFSPDTFNYVTLDIAADGKRLAVDSWGIDSYQPNTFPDPGETGAPRHLLGFRIEIE